MALPSISSVLGSRDSRTTSSRAWLSFWFVSSVAVAPDDLPGCCDPRRLECADGQTIRKVTVLR